MNTFAKPISLVVILLIVFALVNCKDQKAEEQQVEVPIAQDHDSVFFLPVPGKKYIVLLVNTALADSIPSAKAKEISSFPLQHAVSDSLYITEVFKSDTVVWLGVSTSAPTEDKVEITMINHRGGKNILGPSRAEDGKVVGIINDNDNLKPSDKESYAIHFKVNIAGNPQQRTYILDPLLRVH